MSLSKLFSDNYDYLNTVAKRITRCKNIKMAPELLSTTYLVIYEKHEKGMFVPTENEEFVKWFSKCMKNYFTWPNSDFNKVYAPKEALTLNSVNRFSPSARQNKGTSFRGNGNMERVSEYTDFLIDEDALRNIEIGVEQANDFTKELIEISSSMGKTKTLKFIELVEFKRTLPAHEAILFELYWEKELSTRKIAAMYSDETNVMNYQSVNIMVNQIKSKIKTYQWKH